MGRKKLDVIGQKYGRLTILSDVGTKKGKRVVMCKCDCGEMFYGNMANLRNGRTQSCGCLKSERAKARTLKHGESKTKLYKAWRAMTNRCYNSEYYQYARFGGNGVGICEEWKTDFSAFKAWAYEHGYRDDVKCYIRRRYLWDNYSPENCYVQVCADL